MLNQIWVRALRAMSALAAALTLSCSSKPESVASGGSSALPSSAEPALVPSVGGTGGAADTLVAAGAGSTAEAPPNPSLIPSRGPGEMAVEVPLPAPRTDLVLGPGWRFLAADAAGAEQPGFDDAQGAWQSVSVPHTWNALDGQDGGSNYRRGVGWYRLHFTSAGSAPGRRTYLQFDAANSVATVYLNGQRLGAHRGGFAGFRLDATAALAAGDNLLAVQVDNSATPDVPPLSADFTFFGGLYRDVHLIGVSDLHVDLDDVGSSGVYLETRDVSAEAAELRARVSVRNAAEQAAVAHVTLAIADAAGTAVASYEADLPLDGGETAELPLAGRIVSPHLWDGRADPYLYQTSVRVERAGTLVDVVEQPLGFRSFSVDANSGFSLNGRALDLHGVNRHQDRIDLGWAIGKAEHEQDLALILELGASAVRLAHYQHSQYFYELCDRAGLVVWAEIPLVDAITNSQAFTDNARQQLRELIRQSYNHPSILFWGIGNEQRTDDAPTNALLANLAALVGSEDPSRLSTYAHCCSSDTGGLTQHTDLSAYNEYFGWYTGTYDQFAAWADTLHATRPSARLALSEYGAGASLNQHQEPAQKPDPGGAFHPEEYQALFHEAHWLALRSRPYLWGKFIWNMFDFASDTRGEGDAPGRNDKGLISYDRKTKKDAFFWYKANWSTEPFVHITGRRFQPRMGAALDVKVYSNLPRVSLRVNAVDVSELSAIDHIFRWPGTALRQGANQVEVIGKSADGTALASDSVSWTRQ